MTDVLEINDIEGLRSFHLAWNALLADTPRASFFHTLEWLETYWRHFGEGQRLRVLIVRSHERPIGIVPLVERTEPSRLGPVRVLTYPLEDWGVWYGPIGPNQTATLAVAMRHVASTPRQWDVFEPRWMPHESSDRGRTARAMRLAGLPAEIENHAQTSVIECGLFEGWDDYLASRSSKTRHEIRRQRRKLERDHWVEHLRHRPESLRNGGGDPRWDLFNQCLEISRRSWQALSTTGNTLCQGRVRAFLRDAHEQASRLGMVDMNVLSVDGLPAAYYYGYRADFGAGGGNLFGLRMGYDPGAAQGAGSVMLARVIEGSFALGDERIDLGVGGEPYKARLRTAVETSSRLTHTRALALRPQALRVAKRLGQRLRRAG